MAEELPVLGRLRSVELRDVWPSEPYSFTPWLAQAENLQFLAEALGLPGLELVATERQVDIFSADIVARATPSQETVLIENQIERTDHTHLGQILTYAAGLDAAIIVWIARRFTDGHRAAIDWLNRITTSEFAFFGVEVEALRIEDSPPAPRFNVVARPNAFSRELKAATVASEASAETEAATAFWSGYEDAARSIGGPFRIGLRPVRSANYYVKLGKVGQVYLTAWRGVSSSSIGLYLALYKDPLSAAVRAAITPSQENVEAAFGGPLTWEEQKNGVVWLRAGRLTAPADPNDYPRQHAWLADAMKRLNAAVSPYVLQVQAERDETGEV